MYRLFRIAALRKAVVKDLTNSPAYDFIIGAMEKDITYNLILALSARVKTDLYLFSWQPYRKGQFYFWPQIRR
jgi:hypothetical protein